MCAAPSAARASSTTRWASTPRPSRGGRPWLPTSRHPPSTASPSTARSRSSHVRQATSALPARRPQAHVRQGRLLRGRVRHLHRARGRPRHQGVRPHHAPGQRPRHRDRGGPAARGAGRPSSTPSARWGAVQCGFCIPGMVMAGAALIHKVPDPSEDQVKVAHPRQRLSLHRLQEDHRGHPARCRDPAGREEHRPGARARRRLRRGQARLPR